MLVATMATAANKKGKLLPALYRKRGERSKKHLLNESERGWKFRAPFHKLAREYSAHTKPPRLTQTNTVNSEKMCEGNMLSFGFFYVGAGGVGEIHKSLSFTMTIEKERKAKKGRELLLEKMKGVPFTIQIKANPPTQMNLTEKLPLQRRNSNSKTYFVVNIIKFQATFRPILV